jgi:hypothetical protein
MTLTVRAYQDSDAPAWDELCARAVQATLLHTRRFLSYHGNRFTDRSVVVERAGAMVAVLPAALLPGDAAQVSSHPGLTYGGLVYAADLGGSEVLDALAAVAAHYRAGGIDTLLYKVVPAFYQRQPAQADLYALFRLGARRVRCDLSSTIDLACPGPVSTRRARGHRKALARGVSVQRGPHHLAELWPVLTDNLARKHGVGPVHALAEITALADRFGAAIECVVALHEAMVIAGVVLFHTPTATHAQYIASSAQGYQLSALDLVFADCVDHARAAGRRWFDFGISTEQGGTVLNGGLHQFKSEFGAGSTVHEFYELSLREEAPCA